MRRATASRIAAILLAMTAPGLAQTSDAVEQEEIVVQAFGATHPDCATWSDGCVVCRRAGDAAACSTPGIACIPQPTACRAPKP